MFYKKLKKERQVYYKRDTHWNNYGAFILNILMQNKQYYIITMHKNEKEETMEEIDLIELFKIFWRRKIQIILIILIFMCLGYIYTTKHVTPMYTASTTLVLTSSDNQNNTTNSITATDIVVNSKLVDTYSELTKSKNILEEVISNLGMSIKVEKLKNSITVSSVENTELIEIKVKNVEPENSAKIANEVAKVFIKRIAEFYNINNVQIVDEAQIPTTPSNINHKKDIIMFTLIGALISVAYVVIANMLDTTIKSADELEKICKYPVLASIPIYVKNKKSQKEKELIVDRDPKSPVSEVFRTLRTNIQFMNAKNESKVVLVTSTLPGEGKSWISSNLAATFAQAGKVVLLIDADMRKGRQYNIFNTSPKPGLSNYLSGIGSSLNDENEVNNIENYIQETEVENLYMIPAGDIPPNPSELLISKKMSLVIEELKDKCDIIIIDGTPCELVTDSVVLTRLADITIMVTSYKQTKRESLKKIIENIRNIGGENIGIILNKIHISDKKYEERYYYGSTEISEKSNNNIEKEIDIKESKNQEDNKNIENKINENNDNKLLEEKKKDILKQIDDFMENQKEEN